MKSAARRLPIAAVDHPTVDPLGEFDTETPDVTPADKPAIPLVRVRRAWVMWALGLAALVQAPLVVLWTMGRPLTFGQSSGAVHIDSAPAGAQVRVDGKALGVTPLALTLDPGDRRIEVQQGDVVRELPLTVRAGEVVRQRIEFLAPVSAPPAASRGALSVTTEGARAPVFIDGTLRGTSPVVVPNLEPGDHTVRIPFSSGTVERTIRVESGATASLVATMPPAAGAVSGFISVTTRHPLQIFEQGRLIGTSEFDRLMLPTGEHALEFVSDELGFRARRTVRVTPGTTTSIAVELPRAALSINAQPWASVWLDGESLGDTPIGNFMTTIGRHEVVVRHPDFGERRGTALVTLKGPARISFDLRRPE
jgi:PEGA domain-containing protein